MRERECAVPVLARRMFAQIHDAFDEQRINTMWPARLAEIEELQFRRVPALRTVVLQAASNAGGLLLVQWLGRGRELATRHALGATSGRIVASLLQIGRAPGRERVWQYV